MAVPVVPTSIWNGAAFFSSLQVDLAGVGAAGAGADQVAGPTGQVGLMTKGTPVPAETKGTASVTPIVAAPTVPATYISNVAGPSSPAVAALGRASSVEEPGSSIISNTSFVPATSPSSSARNSRVTRLIVSRPSRPDAVPSATQTDSTMPDLSSNVLGKNTIPPEATTAPVNRSTLRTRVSTPITELSIPGSARETAKASSSPAVSSIGPSPAASVSVGVKAAIALGTIIFIFIVVMTACLLWRRRRKRRALPELLNRDDKSVGRFELAAESSKSNTRRVSCEKPTEELECPPPAVGSYGSFPSAEKPAWRPWRLSRWRGRQELDGGWRPPEMQGRKFHEKSAP